MKLRQGHLSASRKLAGGQQQQLDFARELADRWYVMDRGEVTISGDRASMDEDDIRRRMSV